MIKIVLIDYLRKSSLDELFLEKSWLFLRILNSRWSSADAEADRVANLLMKHGIELGSSVLDLGCGNGRVAVHLARKGYRVVGLDYSKVFIEDARVKAREHGVLDRIVFRVGDVRRVDELFEPESFNAVFIYWITIIEYYLDPKIDRMVFEKLWRITRRDRYLFILKHASLESIACRVKYCGLSSYYVDIDDELAMIEKPELDSTRSLTETTWIFYRKHGKNLEFVDQECFKIRLYTLHELVELASSVGWVFVDAYSDLGTLKPYRPGSGFNIVFQKH